MSTADNNYGWRAAVTDDWFRFGVRLHFFRRYPEGTEEVIGFDEQGEPETVHRPEGTVSDFPGFALDRDAVQSLAEQLKPGPSTAELKRLEESLAVERARLDQVLDRLTPVVTMPEPSTPVSAVLESFESDVPSHGWVRADLIAGADASGERLSDAWFEGWAAHGRTGGDLKKVGDFGGCTCIRSGGELLRSDVPCPVHVERLDRDAVRAVAREMRADSGPVAKDAWVAELERIAGPA